MKQILEKVIVAVVYGYAFMICIALTFSALALVQAIWESFK